MKRKSVPGATVAIVAGDSVAFFGAFGFANYDTKTAMRPEMLFRLGSTTKMFVATAALMLVDQGKLDLGLPIRTYVSGLPAQLGALTMHQLLSHTAGLFDDAPMFGPSDDAALGREIHSWTDDNLFLEPGMFLSYSNPGYWMAGYVIETISGRPFADAMNELVFRPLGMNHSMFRPEEASQFPLALGHDEYTVIEPQANHSGTWPSGSLYSTVEDLSRFVLAVMNGGMLHGRRIVAARVVEQLLTPRIKIPERSSGWYGYGLVFEERRGAQYVFHAGSRSGFGSIIRMVPDNRFAVIVLANHNSAIMGATADKATEMYVNLKDEPEARPFTLIREDADRYEGVFVCPPKIEVELYLNGVLHMKMGWPRSPVKQFSDTEYTNSIVPFTVTVDSNGTVQYIHAELHTVKRVDH